MATDRPRITVTVDEETLRRIEAFRYFNRISTLSKACNELILLALEEHEQFIGEHGEEIEQEEQEFDAIYKMDQLMKDLQEMKENMMKNRERKGKE